MSSTVLEIYNLALSKCGSTDQLTSTGEASFEASLCNLHYVTVRDTVMAAAYWQVNKRFAVLTLQATRDTSIAWVTTEPDPPWTFRYTLPTGMLRPRYLADWQKFEISLTGGTRRLHTDSEDAILCYSIQETDTTLWNQDETTAVICGLAAALAIPLTGKRSRSIDLVQEANDYIMRARIAAGNEDQQQNAVLPDWLAARGYVGISATLPRYVYPVGNLLATYNG